MSIFDTLEKRHHVYEYHKKNIPDELVKELLYKAWKISPSKHNFMPYKVTVLGPNKQKEKDKMWKKCVYNHRRAEALGLKEEKSDHVPKSETAYTFNINPAYNHVRYNSHLLIFSARVCGLNPYMERMVRREGHYAEQCEVKEVGRLRVSTSFEAALFASNMTALCIENGIDVSYNHCFPWAKDEFKNMPYLWYDNDKKETRVFCNMSLGYGKYYRHQWLKEVKHSYNEDIKPEVDEVVKWI